MSAQTKIKTLRDLMSPTASLPDPTEGAIPVLVGNGKEALPTDSAVEKLAFQDPLIALDGFQSRIAASEKKGDTASLRHRDIVASSVVEMKAAHDLFFVREKTTALGQVEYEYIPCVESILQKNHRRAGAKWSNPALPLSKLCMELATCKATTRYSRDGKNGECLFYAINNSLSGPVLLADITKEGGRDRYAQKAAKARKKAHTIDGDEGEMGKIRSQISDLLQESAVYEAPAPAPHIAIEQWARLVGDGTTNKVFLLPPECETEITNAVLRILKKHEKKKGQ